MVSFEKVVNKGYSFNMQQLDIFQLYDTNNKICILFSTFNSLVNTKLVTFFKLLGSFSVSCIGFIKCSSIIFRHRVLLFDNLLEKLDFCIFTSMDIYVYFNPFLGWGAKRTSYQPFLFNFYKHKN